jgi:IclR family transcriptional regulator, positive regulator for flagellar biogenesis
MPFTEAMGSASPASQQDLRTLRLPTRLPGNMRTFTHTLQPGLPVERLLLNPRRLAGVESFTTQWMALQAAPSRARVRKHPAEGTRSRWVGRASNPVGGAQRRRVGSTPIPLRPSSGAFLELDSRIRLPMTRHRPTVALVNPRAPVPAEPDAVNALLRGFEVLECVAAARRPLGNAEIAQLTAIPRPTVSRLLATLVGLGQLRPAREGTGYELGAGVVRLAQAFLGAFDVRPHARPHLVELAEACSASAFLAVRDATEMLVIEAGRSRSAVALLGSDVGTRMSVATSALGRAWLAGVDEPTRQAVLVQLRNGPASTRAAAGRALDLALAETRQRGHALSLGEWHPNINSAAVAVRTPGGEVVAINCGGPAFLMPRERLENFVVPRLLKAAESLARDIGGAVTPMPSPTDRTAASRRRTRRQAA